MGGAQELGSDAAVGVRRYSPSHVAFSQPVRCPTHIFLDRKGWREDAEVLPLDRKDRSKLHHQEVGMTPPGQLGRNDRRGNVRATA
jgi:hypothetical protein